MQSSFSSEQVIFSLSTHFRKTFFFELMFFIYFIFALTLPHSHYFKDGSELVWVSRHRPSIRHSSLFYSSNILFFIIVSTFWDLLLCCYYFPLYCCVTCKFLPRGITKGTSYLIISGAFLTELTIQWKLILKYGRFLYENVYKWLDLGSIWCPDLEKSVIWLMVKVSFGRLSL